MSLTWLFSIFILQLMSVQMCNEKVNKYILIGNWYEVWPGSQEVGGSTPPATKIVRLKPYVGSQTRACKRPQGACR